MASLHNLYCKNCFHGAKNHNSGFCMIDSCSCYTDPRKRRMLHQFTFKKQNSDSKPNELNESINKFKNRNESINELKNENKNESNKSSAVEKEQRLYADIQISPRSSYDYRIVETPMQNYSTDIEQLNYEQLNSDFKINDTNIVDFVSPNPAITEFSLPNVSQPKFSQNFNSSYVNSSHFSMNGVKSGEECENKLVDESVNELVDESMEKYEVKSIDKSADASVNASVEEDLDWCHHEFSSKRRFLGLGHYLRQ